MRYRRAAGGTLAAAPCCGAPHSGRAPCHFGAAFLCSPRRADHCVGRTESSAIAQNIPVRPDARTCRGQSRPQRSSRRTFRVRRERLLQICCASHKTPAQLRLVAGTYAKRSSYRPIRAFHFLINLGEKSINQRNLAPSARLRGPATSALWAREEGVANYVAKKC
jgi:hypothetical protein